MSQPDRPETKAAPLFAPAFAMKLVALLLAGVFAVLALAAFDHARRQRIETFAQVTAVEDRVFLPLPAPAKPLLLDGRELRVVDPAEHNLRDTAMRQLGRDAATGVTIYHYQLSDGKTRADDTFVKTAPNRYVRVESSEHP